MHADRLSQPCPRGRRRANAFAAAVAVGATSLILATSAVTGLAIAGSSEAPFELASARPVDPATEAAIQSANSLSQAFRHASQTIVPSVVNIETIRREAARPAMQTMPWGQRMPDGGLSPEDLLKRFFGDMAPDLGRPSPGPSFPMPAPQMRGQGSGVIVAEDGYIVTNNHVVAGAEELKVRLHDGREYEGKIVGTDPETDLALIKIEASDLTPATFGDSDALEQGDWVVAVGSPFGLEHTVTSGIVSAKQRGDMGITLFEDFIQTDAAINPGNSGGPLVNLRGEVVGINTAIRSQNGGSDGIGFAIPATTVKQVIPGLRDGKVHRGWLGVQIQPLDDDLARSFGFSGRGVLVAEALEDGPAKEAGLRSGDIITKVNDRSIDDPGDLVNAIAALSPKQTVKLQIFRDGEARKLTVTLGERPGLQELASAAGAPMAPAETGLGLKVAPTEDGEGVMVEAVAPGSPAGAAGIRPGDILLAVGADEVDSPSELAKALRDADEGKSIRFKLRRGETIRFVLVTPGR